MLDATTTLPVADLDFDLSEFEALMSIADSLADLEPDFAPILPQRGGLIAKPVSVYPQDEVTF